MDFSLANRALFASTLAISCPKFVLIVLAIISLNSIALVAGATGAISFAIPFHGNDLAAGADTRNPINPRLFIGFHGVVHASEMKNRQKAVNWCRSFPAVRTPDISTRLFPHN